MTVDSWGVHCCGCVQTEPFCTCCGEFKRKDRWVAAVTHNWHTYRFGPFDSPEEAAAEATAARLRMFTHNDHDRVAQ